MKTLVIMTICLCQVLAFGQIPQSTAKAYAESAKVYYYRYPACGNLIRTGPNEIKIVIFPDKSKLTVYPNAFVKIDAYVYNPNLSMWQLFGVYIRGGFRWISGLLPRENVRPVPIGDIRG